MTTLREIPEIKPGYIVQLIKVIYSLPRLKCLRTRGLYSIVEAVVVARRNAGLNSTYRIRRLVAGVGVETMFSLLSNMAISYYNDKTDTSLELVKVLRANFHPSAAITLYITFEANDPKDGNQTKRYQAVVLYLSFDIEVCSCKPEPSS
ncbi:Translation protein SH3-like domain superfamily [Arabidopsis suecica]|uniref:Translation protein SH3-like domain superfamily n=1 Tax=Arabidopsis suecica TaxID=45249 RepID=A0A8T1Z510_ARASU|nr:Translation protein SH3-like domain superfamily [Arabidopsis suecica]